MGETAKERTGWRDEGISRRHRKWGVECQMTDIDFFVIEYRCEYRVVSPVALIEYKNEHAPFDLELLAYTAIRQVSDSANLPFFLVRYTSDFKTYRAIAMNAWANARLAAKERQMTELEYVTFLYKLRHYDAVPQKVIDAIKALQQPTLFSETTS